MHAEHSSPRDTPKRAGISGFGPAERRLSIHISRGFQHIAPVASDSARRGADRRRQQRRQFTGKTGRPQTGHRGEKMGDGLLLDLRRSRVGAKSSCDFFLISRSAADVPEEKFEEFLRWDL